MSRTTSRLTARRRSTPWLHRWSRPIIIALATIGALDTGYITLEKWGIIKNLACPAFGGGCEKVLNSPYATIFGQPLSLFGFLAYVAMALLAALPLFVNPDRNKKLRSSLEQQTWLLLFLGGVAMTVFSGYLVYLMAFEIKAFCLYCLGSALFSLSFLILSIIGHDWKDMGQALFGGLITAMVVLLGTLGVYANIKAPVSDNTPGEVAPPVTTPSNPSQIALAQHLKQIGAKMYTAYWCPHCYEQKQLFGQEAVKSLNLVECDPQGRNAQPKLCQEKGIQGFPTWEINGKLDSGVKPLEKLAQLSGYSGPTNFPTLDSVRGSMPSSASPLPAPGQ
jgi:uncharacterized membrane protein/glutaredoxin